MSPLCEHCEERLRLHDEDYCETCRDNLAEDAYERFAGVGVFPTSKAALHGAAFHAFMAGTHYMRRTHWLLLARGATERTSRDLYISFARAAHRSYLKDLRRALA